jgi:hypothetical protein
MAAENWIKMRTQLRTSPKVVRISSALNADRLRVVGALHAVWGLADEHSPDGLLDGYTLQVLDDLIGWPGFSAAMRDVDWLIEIPQGLEIPRFEDHNGTSAKRRAMEADRKKRGRESANLPLELGQVSASNADKKRTRGEESREEEKKGAGAPAEWIDQKAWSDFEAHRKSKRAALTRRAVELIVQKLATFRAAGVSPTAVLNYAIENGHTGLYYKPTTGGVAPAAVSRVGTLGSAEVD